MTTSKVDGRMSLHTLDHSATDHQIQAVLNLSNTVFAVENSERSSPNSTLDGWRSRLGDPQASITYIASQDESKIAGFFFSYPKVQPEIGFETYHIWLAGIDETLRGHGLFQRLLEATKEVALRHGFNHLSVCTVPDRFTTMYRILQKHGWEFIAWREDDRFRKVLMKLRIA